MPNRQRTLHSFFSAVGARGPAASPQLETPAADPAEAAPAPHASTGDSADGDAEASEHPRNASATRRSEATATSPHARSHDIGAMPMQLGEKPKQDALRGVTCVVTSFDLDGRCSYAGTHKCRSAAWHWSRCIVVDHPDVVVQWEDTERTPLADLVRCERCAVGIHPACAIDQSE